MKLTLEFDNKRIENLFVTAMEGGSNYWADFPAAPPGEGAPSERLIRHVLDGGSITIADQETADEWLLTAASIRRGLQAMRAGSPEHFADMLGENWDAETADAWLQYCTIGEYVFG